MSPPLFLLIILLLTSESYAQDLDLSFLRQIKGYEVRSRPVPGAQEVRELHIFSADKKVLGVGLFLGEGSAGSAYGFESLGFSLKVFHSSDPTIISGELTVYQQAKEALGDLAIDFHFLDFSTQRHAGLIATPLYQGNMHQLIPIARRDPQLWKQLVAKMNGIYFGIRDYAAINKGTKAIYDLHGSNIFYRITGQSDSPKLLLVAGDMKIGEPLEAFEESIDFIASGYKNRQQVRPKIDASIRKCAPANLELPKGAKLEVHHLFLVFWSNFGNPLGLSSAAKGFSSALPK